MAIIGDTLLSFDVRVNPSNGRHPHQFDVRLIACLYRLRGPDKAVLSRPRRRCEQPITRHSTARNRVTGLYVSA